MTEEDLPSGWVVQLAMQEFLILHHLTTDSARDWDVFLDNCLPECTWVGAGPRLALALHMYDKCHIAPSHLAALRPTEVYVRGFGADIEDISHVLD